MKRADQLMSVYRKFAETIKSGEFDYKDQEDISTYANILLGNTEYTSSDIKEFHKLGKTETTLVDNIFYNALRANVRGKKKPKIFNVIFLDTGEKVELSADDLKRGAGSSSAREGYQ